MLAFLPALIRVPLVLLLLALNVLVHVLPLFALTLLKLVVPVAAWRRLCSRLLVAIAESWIGANNLLFALFTRIHWQVDGLEGLRRDANYLVLANHQSWVDIPVLQKLLNRRIPFLRFFLKSQLIWVPLMGPAWWALDFPFMKRYSKETLARHPELAGRDMEATRRACAKFRQLPVSVMNFVEGTRFTPAKHDAQGSPYRHLLKPRAGGVAFVLDAMGEGLDAILDVAIAYPGGPCSMMDLVTGRLREVRVSLREQAIPRELRGDYEGDAAFRQRFQAWVNALWREQDVRMAGLLEAPFRLADD
ncbi:acyltransferase [Rhodanobacter sp. DHG33]|uniref:acyltransferase n=1 Tax=Rhodanobacter sp. DHG33 TaxID=2775921 RepID=UPI0017801C3E|nr:acyltransferase [Rhodanobacter sp. DHG33]MBD8897993.1 acyltransferase [Rhodanobacter sp. DHG33]